MSNATIDRRSKAVRVVGLCIGILCCTILQVVARSAQAQTSPSPSDPTASQATSSPQKPKEENITFGVGLSFSPITIAGDDQNRFQTVGMTDFVVPIQLGPYIRVEPELGLYFQNQQQTLTDTIGSFLQHTSRQLVRTGIGVFYTRQPDMKFQWGIGARLGILSSEYETNFDRQSILDSNHASNYAIFYTAACFTVEYWLVKRLSIGGEFQLNFYTYGSPITTPIKNSYPANTSSQSVVSTNEVIALRFYF